MQGWYNQNENRWYPLVRDDSLGDYKWIHGLIVDCGFVIGESRLYDEISDSVLLKRILRVGSSVVVEFSVKGSVVSFTLDLDGSDYQMYSQQYSLGACDDDCPVDAFVVFGKIERVLDDVHFGETLVSIPVEPSTVQNLGPSYIHGVSVANDDRIRATTPSGCPDITWPFEVKDHYPVEECLVGDISFTGGYNCIVSQNSSSRTITIGAAESAGSGKGCDSLEKFPGEQKADGRDTFDGSLRCNEALRSVNGIGGGFINLASEQGATVTVEPGNNKIIVDFDSSRILGADGDPFNG